MCPIYKVSSSPIADPFCRHDFAGRSIPVKELADLGRNQWEELMHETVSGIALQVTRHKDGPQSKGTPHAQRSTPNKLQSDI